MAEMLTSAQMRALEETAMASGAVTGMALMERAGQGVVDAIFAEWPDLASAAQDGPSDDETLEKDKNRGARGAVVLCGPGNNGGDGYVVARLLRDRGWAVSVYLVGSPDALPPDARANHDRWGGPVLRLPVRAEDAEGMSLLVDALFGIGLTRAFNVDVLDEPAVLLAMPNVRRVAVDVPSGLNADTGCRLGRCLAADLTVTFQTAKPGHVLSEGPALCGALRIVDIGLGDLLHSSAAVEFLDAEPIRSVEAPRRLAKRRGHKFDHGHALVLSGPPGAGGAARLAARAALRVGAGLVTLGCPLRAVPEHAAHLNAIMLRGLDGTHGLSEALEDARITALCLGPGLGLGPATAELVRHALAAGRGTVLDADALSRFQRQPDALFEMLHPACVLTPHGGEFKRLFADLYERLTQAPEAFSRIDAAREAAMRAGCVVLFKGPDTVIAAPDGQVAVNAAVYDRAAPWLATAGSGDVLAGIITGLLARGMGAFEAACTGAWLHTEAARAFGPGLIAEDLPETLPKVFRDLGL